MTLNLTPEEKIARRKEFKKQYGKAYYHWLKENEPEKYQARVDKATELSTKRYYAKKGMEVPTERKKGPKIHINLDHVYNTP
jgi:hypothetical protein